MRLSVIDCLARGLGSLRANWELVVVQWLLGIVVTALVIVGFLPVLLVIGPEVIGSLTAGADWAKAVAGGWPAIEERLAGLWAPLLVAALAMTLIWVLAALVYSFLTGGVLGVLMAGDRQAPAGRPRDWRWFRTFSGRDLVGWGGRYVWRYFVLVGLWGAIFLGWSVVVLLVAGLTVWGAQRWGGSAAAGIGCGGALPLTFLTLVLFAWSPLSFADLAQEDSRAGKALRRSLQILARRLGAVLLLIVLLVAATVAVSVGFLPFTLGLRLGLGSGSIAGMVGDFSVALLQQFLHAILSIGFVAALMALVRSEIAAGTVR